jgi:hypothetical protein
MQLNPSCLITELNGEWSSDQSYYMHVKPFTQRHYLLLSLPITAVWIVLHPDAFAMSHLKDIPINAA